jgi:hypothetical protein
MVGRVRLPDDGASRALLGNVGTLIAFRVGVRDAKVLADEFFPEFSVEDLISLARGTHLRPAFN